MTFYAPLAARRLRGSLATGLVVGGFAASLVGCTGQKVNVNVADPQLALSPTSIDFGEVTRGIKSTIGINVSNSGYGSLDFSSIALDSLTSSEFQIVSAPTSGMGHGDPPQQLVVSYTPTAQGEDIGNVEIVSSDPVNPDFLVPLTAVGVEPAIDLNPSELNFGIVPMGTPSDPQTVIVSAVGSGNLVIQGTTITGAGAGSYAFTAPGDYVEPYTLENGHSISLSVVFTPIDDTEQDANIEIATNAVDSLGVVQLIGNVPDDPNTNTPPTVQITAPNNGEYFVDNVPAALTGHVVDPDDDVTHEVCQWFANGTPEDVGYPDADGNVAADVELPAGDTTVQLQCMDAAHDTGQDSVVVTVWQHDQPMQYVLSGGATEFDYISVDDDLEIDLNGSKVYADNDHTRTNLPPIALNAASGDQIRLIVTDQNACDASAPAMQLHWGTASSQVLNNAVCYSSCPDHPCYDGTYAGPWPGIILDETYTISIP